MTTTMKKRAEAARRSLTEARKTADAALRAERAAEDALAAEQDRADRRGSARTEAATEASRKFGGGA